MATSPEHNPNFRRGLMVNYVQDSLYRLYVPRVGGRRLETLLEEVNEEAARLTRLADRDHHESGGTGEEPAQPGRD